MTSSCIKDVSAFSIISQNWHVSPRRTMTGMFIGHDQYHDGWCPGDVRSQGISRHGIDLLPEYSGFSTRRVNTFETGACVLLLSLQWRHNGAIASQTTSLSIVYSTVNSDADQRKHKSSMSLAFVWGIHRWPVNSPHKGPVTRQMFPFDDVIMLCMECLDIGYIIVKVTQAYLMVKSKELDLK